MPSRADAAPSFLHLPALGAVGEELELAPDEAHYVARVCRAREGERVQATDGRGGLAVLTLLTVRGAVRARVDSVEVEMARRRAHVLCGAPEGQRADWLVEKLAELGVGRLTLVDGERARWPEGAARRERWTRLAVAAMRQSRRRWRLTIDGPVGLAGAIAGLPTEGARWLAHAAAPPAPLAASEGLAVGAIGPAEGFTAVEVGVLEGVGFQPISLADARLRCETAAVAWAAWWATGATR